MVQSILNVIENGMFQLKSDTFFFELRIMDHETKSRVDLLQLF
jgi:hypothetical protein